MGELRARLNDQMTAHGLDAVVVAGTDNFTYISGTVAPFALQYPNRTALVVATRNGRDVVVCPADWVEAVSSQGWTGDLVTYNENQAMPPRAAIDTLASVIRDRGLGRARLGIDTWRMNRRFAEAMRGALEGCELLPCDAMLGELRAVKTRAEIELLEIAAMQTERGIMGSLNHVEGAFDVPGGVGYTVGECAHRMRVHISDFGASFVGHLAAMRGADAHLYYGPQRMSDLLQRGDLVRMDVTYQCRGYWANAGRMVVIGESTDEQERAYRDNQMLKNVAVEMLKPGVACRDVIGEVRKVAAQEQIRFWEEVGIGHGIGVSCSEEPYLTAAVETTLQTGMVLVLDVYTYGPREELIHSKDTYELVNGGTRLLSWHRNWNTLYAVTGVQTVTVD